MKKTCFFLLFICLTILVFPQERERYFDAPFGGGGSFTLGWMFPNFNDLNSQLEQFNVPKLSNSGLFTTGGSGFVYIGIVKNLRIGGMGFGGSKSVSAEYTHINVPPIAYPQEKREVDYSIGGGGLTVEYTLPFVRDFGISVGGIIGSGSVNIDIYKNSGDISWNNLWNQANTDLSPDYARHLHDSYWFFTPTLNIDIPLYRFVVLRVGGGYQLTFADSWKIDNDMNLTDVPSGLNGNAFFIQTGIFLGFFSF